MWIVHLVIANSVIIFIVIIQNVNDERMCAVNGSGVKQCGETVPHPKLDAYEYVWVHVRNERANEMDA